MNAGFSEQRVKMVDGQIRTTDVTSAPLLAALLDIPREAFIAPEQAALAYIDEDIRIADTPQGPRYLMEPSPLARLIQLADVGIDDRVLVVGCGCGYASAIFSRLARSVTALESDAALAEGARLVLSRLGFDNIDIVQGALQEGYSAAAPYDVIFIDGSVEEVPETLLAQLSEGGRLVAVEGYGNAGVARLFLKTTGIATGRRAFNAAIKPLPGFERAHAFEF
ncbi:protein-L-isoaspartate O-methyltransferase family protein [Manganibacter manganicus]|uniref:Protein-L-isoaspartate O-methyltransferase n=1 Tax=Manganibacter manganicus TaxID=1873176 RepID=A0A1V8RUT0_9HYPH|nr:protein-L-isoaspartate O-methyltransferase [Pseudaminobacter manganicus]OQM76942.1 protein-L-isoaspartate O-methyltransferase [Pseudaminobacter manganicus]